VIRSMPALNIGLATRDQAINPQFGRCRIGETSA
jgi:hypothetical protein